MLADRVQHPVSASGRHSGMGLYFHNQKNVVGIILLVILAEQKLKLFYPLEKSLWLRFAVMPGNSELGSFWKHSSHQNEPQ